MKIDTSFRNWGTICVLPGRMREEGGNWSRGARDLPVCKYTPPVFTNPTDQSWARRLQRMRSPLTHEWLALGPLRARHAERATLAPKASGIEADVQFTEETKKKESNLRNGSRFKVVRVSEIRVAASGLANQS